LIAPHLDRECAARWVAAVCHKTAQEIKEWIADRKPKDGVSSSVRRVASRRLFTDAEASRLSASRKPVTTGAARGADAVASSGDQVARSFEALAAPPSPLERGRGKCEPLGAKRYYIRFEADEDFHQQLQELRALLRHQVPDGDVAKILARATNVLLEQVRKQKIGACASSRSPRSRQTPSSSSSSSSSSSTDAPSKMPSRTIPAAIRRAVWARDAGRCTYVSREGRRCGSRDFLEFHHQVPWARSRQHAIPNIHLRCRSHNQHAAELDFGFQQVVCYRKRGVAHPGEPAGAGSQLDLNPVEP
jgi:5-methylcytosine-specific restriction endonuclease McrA